MTALDLPVLVVGDVHGDLERLFEALKPYPAEDWHTIFLGDLVDYGMFGVGALRFARDRPNTDVILGNHEVAMLWALRDDTRIGYWMSIGGQRHDLDELAKDEALEAWVRNRPALLKLPDATLFQHTGSDAYLDLIEEEPDDVVDAINTRTNDLLHNGGEAELWELMSGPNVFESQPLRLDRWLYHEGRAINFDGGLSRAHRLHQRGSPLTASVGPLD
jgi:serine/threonine protein phosphatase 1